MDSPQTYHLNPNAGPACSAEPIPGTVIDWERPIGAEPLAPLSIRIGAEEMRLLKELSNSYGMRISTMARRLLVAQLMVATHCDAAPAC